MKKYIIGVIIGVLSLGLGLGTLQAQNKVTKDQLETQAHRINKEVDKANAMKLALQRISTETGVPIDRVQAMHKDHPDIGPAGVLIANVLADNTKKPPEDFMKKHASGKGWAALARDNNVPLDKLQTRLDHLEAAVAPGATQPGNANKHNRQKS